MDLLRLESLKRAYGERLALEADGISLPPGAVGLLGPNGAGKSTLVQILMGLLPPSSGRAEVLGLDVVSHPLAVRARVGYMSENECFIPGLRAVDHVALAGEVGGMPRRQAHRRAHEVLGCLGVDESRYRRFFTSKHSLSEGEIKFFVEVNFTTHVALVAELKDGARQVIAGGGRYVVTGPRAAEVAFMVDDAHQALGIGSLLMRHLVVCARSAGLEKLVAEVLSGNSAMRKVFERAGLAIFVPDMHIGQG